MSVNPPDSKLRWRLTSAEVDTLTQSGTERPYPAGTTLFLEGDLSYFAVLILAGRVRVTSEKAAALGSQMVFDYRGLHDIVGELSAIDHKPRSATVTAADNVQAVVISPDELNRFLNRNPKAMRRLLVAVIGCLRDTDAGVESGAHHARYRIVRRLLELAQRHGEPTAQGVIRLRTSQKELAGWVGTGLRATTKELKELHETGVIERGQGQITILDLEALQRLEADLRRRRE